MGLKERLTELSERNAKTGCASIIRNNIEAIEQAISNRVPMKSLVDEINAEYKLSISVATFKVELTRYRKARRKTMADNTNKQANVEATNAVEQQTPAPQTPPRQKSKRFDWAAAKRDAPKTLD